MKNNQLIIYGLHTSGACLQRFPENVLKAYVMQGRQDKRLQPLLQQLNQIGLSVENLSRQQLDKLSQNKNHQGIVLEIRQPKPLAENELNNFVTDLTKAPLFLILDGIQDPHNLGACLRSADAAGVDAVIIPKDRSVGLTDTVWKVASGAVASMPIFQVTNLVRSLELLKQHNIWIYGLAGEAEASLYQTDFTGSVALVLGAEGSGIRALTRKHCDGVVAIPMRGSVESLNVSVATGVCLFEVVRQRTI